ncbi:hypothetical protein JJJ17_09915 [Paracoccus caeni]|uniref:Uncharacterized protein n=1 Tax=Paracoccus caeni TaxID=657651 RepID=A0A934VZV2_9RHOB|nr:hypothetical protein [Paracoccus caeni]MBK4216240.1 hypothetical protein [Paracoccus caeni]
MSAEKTDQRPAISFQTRVLRKEEFLPRYIVVKPEYVPGRTAAFPADVMLNEAGPFRRNIRPWGKGSDVFFFNLTAPQCEKAGLGTNDECWVTIRPLTDSESA